VAGGQSTWQKEWTWSNQSEHHHYDERKT